MISKCVTGYAMSVSPFLSLRFGSGVMRWVGTRLTALGDVREAREEVVPTFGVGRDGLLRQAAVHEPKARSLSVRLEVDLDGAGAWRHQGVVFPAPGEHHAA